MSTSANQCARLVLETVPLVMRAIRAEMRSHRQAGLSLVQFRVLIYLNRNKGASLSDAAGHLGLSLPAMSKMVDGLVVRNLVARHVDPGDRRRVNLATTETGRILMKSAYDATQANLAECLAELRVSEQQTVVQAMQVLESIFTSEQKVKSVT